MIFYLVLSSKIYYEAKQSNNETWKDALLQDMLFR